MKPNYSIDKIRIFVYLFLKIVGIVIILILFLLNLITILAIIFAKNKQAGLPGALVVYFIELPYNILNILCLIGCLLEKNKFIILLYIIFLLQQLLMFSFYWFNIGFEFINYDFIYFGGILYALFLLPFSLRRILPLIIRRI